MSETVVGTLLGVFVGGLITWATARYYYRAAANDLKDEADRLSRKSAEDTERALTILARFLEQYARLTIPADRQVKVSFTKDEQGRIVNASVSVALGPVTVKETAGAIAAIKAERAEGRDGLS